MEIIDRDRRLLAPRYEIESEIGRGGSSIVYRALDQRHGRSVAVKVLSQEVWSEVKPERFLREIRIAAKLQHPNILPLFDSGEVDGLLYYVMPFVEGESLGDRLTREGPLPLDDAVSIVTDVAEALGYAHAQGVIHRDIKPGNILLSEGRAIVADFGIARAVDQAADSFRTITGHAPGTPAYMSPEQAGHGEIDTRTDLYSLGCVLYETLTGEPPFSGRTVLAVVAKHLSQPPPSLEVVRPSVPGGLADVFEKSLSKTPADRFQSADEFATAVRLGVHTPQRSKRTPKAGPRLAIAAVLLLSIGIWAWRTALVPESGADPQTVMVFPLVVAGESEEVDLGWDVALAIGTALEHTEPLRWIDGWQWLPEEIRDDMRLATPERLAGIARSRGAGRYISGVIRPAGDSVAVVLRLQDTESDVILGQETEWGLASSPVYEAGLAAIVPLITRLLEPGRVVDLSPLTNRNPGAIALLIQGDRLYRQSQFGDALEFYRRAVNEDSLLAIAAAKGAVAASWEDRYSDALDLAQLAVRQDSLLPVRYRNFVHGVKAYVEGQADTAVTRLSLAVESYPDWVESLGMLGETHYHLLGTTLEPELAARSALEEAVTIDPTFTPPLMHLSEIALRAGDLDQARDWILRLQIVGADLDQTRKLTLMLDCVESGGTGSEIWRREAERAPKIVLDAARDLAVGGAHPKCAEEAFRAAYTVEASRYGSLLGLQALLLAQGRVSETVQLLDSALADGIRGAFNLYLVNAPLSEAFNVGAGEAERLARDPSGEGYLGSSPVTSWLLGMWLALQGDLDRAEVTALKLDSLRAGSRSREARLLATAIEGHFALAGRLEEVAVQKFSGLSPNAPPGRYYWELHESLAVEKILLARSLLARGDYQGAHDVASVFDHPVPIMYLAYLAPSLEIRRQAAEAMRRPDLADRYSGRLVRLGWTNGQVPISASGPLINSSR